jgi:predicted nucleic acid-binding Zn ribbon protein
MALYCEVCGGPLSIATKNRICSAKCRQRKSRNKRQAPQRAYAMGFEIDGWTKMLNEGTLTAAEARDLLDTVWDRLGNFYRLIQEAEQKAARAETGKKA